MSPCKSDPSCNFVRCAILSARSNLTPTYERGLQPYFTCGLIFLKKIACGLKNSEKNFKGRIYLKKNLVISRKILFKIKNLIN